EDVLGRVAARAAKIKVGMPMEPATEMGAMITKAARDRCIAAVERAVGAGARVLTGATVPSDPALKDGAFLAPTVVDRVAADTELANEEIFGPVLSAMTWRTEDEAVALANAGRYGLTAAIWTQDIDKALRTAERIEAGYLWVNDVETRFPAVPFGGWNDSGIGLEHGLEEILSFTRVKAVNVRVR
ncbi:MAG TPA: aldehyde dehydrogenase family protein, partial [Candidatus Limnocylindria bacterium]